MMSEYAYLQYSATVPTSLHIEMCLSIHMKRKFLFACMYLTVSRQNYILERRLDYTKRDEIPQRKFSSQLEARSGFGKVTVSL